VGAINVRFEVVDAQTIDGGINRVVIEVRGVELRHLAPGVMAGGVTFFQLLPPSAREVDQAIVGARPQNVDVEVRRTDGVDHASAGRLLFGGVAVPSHASRQSVGIAGEIGTDSFQFLPPSTVLSTTCAPR